MISKQRVEIIVSKLNEPTFNAITQDTIKYFIRERRDGQKLVSQVFSVICHFDWCSLHFFFSSETSLQVCWGENNAEGIILAHGHLTVINYNAFLFVLQTNEFAWSITCCENYFQPRARKFLESSWKDCVHLSMKQNLLRIYII